MITTLSEHARQQIRAQMNDLADFLAEGGAPDHGVYKELVGKIAGLAWAERLLLDLEEASHTAEAA